MTSMFDQYNTALKREDSTSTQIMSTSVPSSGLISVNMRTTEETPIFSKRKMPISLPQDILFTRVCNNWLVVLMSNNVLLRLYLQQTDRQDGKWPVFNDYRLTMFAQMTHPLNVFRRGVFGEASNWTASGEFIP